MSADSYEITVTIVNELGMHARAATKFVQLASKFPCDILVEKDDQEVNGKSIMGVLMLVASQGSQIKIRANGPNAAAAAQALAELVKNRFGEDR